MSIIIKKLINKKIIIFKSKLKVRKVCDLSNNKTFLPKN